MWACFAMTDSNSSIVARANSAGTSKDGGRTGSAGRWIQPADADSICSVPAASRLAQGPSSRGQSEYSSSPLWDRFGTRFFPDLNRNSRLTDECSTPCAVSPVPGSAWGRASMYRRAVSTGMLLGSCPPGVGERPNSAVGSLGSPGAMCLESIILPLPRGCSWLRVPSLQTLPARWFHGSLARSIRGLPSALSPVLATPNDPPTRAEWPRLDRQPTRIGAGISLE